MSGIWRAFWAELNTPEDFAAEPVKGVTNQAGHMAFAAAGAAGLGSVWTQVFGTVPMWAVSAAVIGIYAVWIELLRQKWQGRDTISDTAFWSLGAVLPASAMSLTPSGRWIRTDEASSAFLIWLACAVLALAVYAYPRAKRKYGGS
jgi:hypothetical protein